MNMLRETKPDCFSDMVRISGLSHGTDVYANNAQDLIKSGICNLKQAICTRDDIMLYLINKHIEPGHAFKIMESVRKGRGLTEEWEAEMREHDVPDWYIGSCKKIKYMFPKAHAAAYVTSAFRIAWYKVHMPVYFYASWLTSKATDVDVESMMKGYNEIREKIIEIQTKGYDATNKESGQLESLKVSLEATARGIKFIPIDLNKSEATTWGVKDETSIYPPFSAIDGLGDTVAKAIVEEREKHAFTSIEDLQKRAKISQTLLDKLKRMRILDNLDESDQLSLF
jgi:DNA polymerase-3 subunit alpha (Gram-positive type)